MKKNYLRLNTKDLIKLGFMKKQGEDGEYWAKNSLNSDFIYNPKESIYVWYYRTTINNACNWMHLKITTKKELLKLFKTLQVKY
jgi:hypothetical protein